MLEKNKGNINATVKDAKDVYSDPENVEHKPWKAGIMHRQRSSTLGNETDRRFSSHTVDIDEDRKTQDHERARKPTGRYTEQGSPSHEGGKRLDISSHDEDQRSDDRTSEQRHTESHRVPYFRYFGPTAIVPGFKRMVVNVPSRDRERRKSRGGSFSLFSSGSLPVQKDAVLKQPFQAETVPESPDDLPVYDPNDPADVDDLIIKLVKTFFLRLGCNYPFLQEATCLRMVKEKRLEPMLVDAMCALAARFALDNKTAAEKCDFGHIFAQRAKAATVDTFACPSVGAVQACLLMAYEGFGENQDSTLWMYLGVAIRMAVDLGLQKLVGVKYQGENDPWYTRNWKHSTSSNDGASGATHETDKDTPSPEEQKEIEAERTQTFWAVFILDRLISSGTGRPVTFRDGDFELSLPEPTIDAISGWPAPLPHFITIIHLYGRVSDVLNNIRDINDLSEDKMTRLAQMEYDLTCIYQNLDSRLVFSVNNFQKYVKFGQATTFMLLHCWFHAMIIVLNQPTLFGSSSRAQLQPDSHNLSISSAKTIAGILDFALVTDPKSFVGNPFISQPIFIAACALLMESAEKEPAEQQPPLWPETQFQRSVPALTRPPKSAKQSLLRSTANQDYQKCYISLQHLQKYWGGVECILTELEKRQKGVWDCDTFTSEEWESLKLPRRASLTRLAKLENPASPNLVPLAFSVTGTTNSPNPSLTLLYQNNVTTVPQETPSSTSSAPVSAAGSLKFDPVRQTFTESTVMSPPAYPQPNISAVRHQVQPATMKRISMSGATNSRGTSFLRYENLQAHNEDTRSHDNTNTMHIYQKETSYCQPSSSYTPLSQHPSSYQSPVLNGASSSSPSNSTVTDLGPSSYYSHSHPSNHQPPNQHDHSSDQGGFVHDGYHSYEYAFGQENWYSTTGSYFQPVQNSDGITLFHSHEIDIGQLGLSNDVPFGALVDYLPHTVLEILDNNLPGNPAEHT
ncbi:hypothetical protein DL546_001811 [Coniochaeta pulveracea]|nr:hypothetical protein DL546_001811 [Coniochaeta pulveracea]